MQHSRVDGIGNHETPTSIISQKRSASDDLPQTPGHKPQSTEYALSRRIEETAHSFVRRVISGASNKSSTNAPEIKIPRTPSASRDVYTALDEFVKMAKSEYGIPMFWWTMASFVSLILGRKTAKRVGDKSARSRMKKWAIFIIGVLNELEGVWRRRSLHILMCLCCMLTFLIEESYRAYLKLTESRSIHQETIIRQETTRKFQIGRTSNNCRPCCRTAKER